MEDITLLYVDDKPDIYVSQYLKDYSNDKAKYIYKELKFKSSDSYESLLKEKVLEMADILLLDSMLFENRDVGDSKISGEELGLIIKKVFPFKEILIVTQFQEKLEYNTLKKYNSNTYSCTSDSFFKDNWDKALFEATQNILLYRKILNTISNKAYVEKCLLEKMENSIKGISSYDNLEKADIDKLIAAFEEMKKSYEGQ